MERHFHEERKRCLVLGGVDGGGQRAGPVSARRRASFPAAWPRQRESGNPNDSAQKNPEPRNKGRPRPDEIERAGRSGRRSLPPGRRRHEQGEVGRSDHGDDQSDRAGSEVGRRLQQPRSGPRDERPVRRGPGRPGCGDEAEFEGRHGALQPRLHLLPQRRDGQGRRRTTAKRSASIRSTPTPTATAASSAP